MQLPDHLLRTYHRYKVEEADLLSWICDTAENVGQHVVAKHSAKMPKLKGRERLMARRAAEAGEIGIDNDHYKEPRIAIFDILPSVKAIADTPNITTIPVDIAIKFHDVLNLRRKCLRWYKTNTSQHDDETRLKNKKHEHPVLVLEQAIGILQHKLPESLPASAVKPPMHHSISDRRTNTATTDAEHMDLAHIRQVVDTSDNAFDFRNHDEDGSGDELPTAGQPTNISQPASIPKLGEEDRIQDEFNLAQYCVYQELRKSRSICCSNLSAMLWTNRTPMCSRFL